MIRLFILLPILLLAACAPAGKTYYVLTASGPVPTGGGIGIGIGPVTLAEYIDRANLATQEAPNQFGFADDHRWAGDLSANIARVTAADLGRLLRTGNVRTYPWQSDSEIRYQVTLDVRQLHSDMEGNAICEIGWRAYSLPDRRLRASKTFTDSEPLETSGYTASVAAQSRLLERLAQNIATTLR